MVSTKWLQGKNNIHEALEIRKESFSEDGDGNFSDFFDEFAFNLVVYEDLIPAGTGRLLFNDGKYLIDNVCVLKEFRGRNYGDLIVRMLVRKAINMGAEKTYTQCKDEFKKLFERVGFAMVKSDGKGNNLMSKNGDVGGHCSNIVNNFV